MFKALAALSLSLCLSSVAYAAPTVLTPDQCAGFAGDVANSALLMEKGKKKAEIVKLVSPKAPKDLQELMKVGVDVVFVFKGQLTANDHFQGAFQFCVENGGDVASMTKTLKEAVAAVKKGI